MMPRQCPTCGADLNGRAVCGHCGTLAGAEFNLARIQHNATAWFDRSATALARQLRPQHFLWACAIMPIFMLPPLVSLIASILALRRGGSGRPAANFEWIAVVSAINLIVSAMILYQFHLTPPDIIMHVGDMMRAIGRLFHVVPTPATPPRLIPIERMPI